MRPRLPHRPRLDVLRRVHLPHPLPIYLLPQPPSLLRLLTQLDNCRMRPHAHSCTDRYGRITRPATFEFDDADESGLDDSYYLHGISPDL
jgi:hypothetical protein